MTPAAPCPPAGDPDDPRICFCMRVHRNALIAAIEAGADTLDALGNRTRAGTGCGTCRIDLLGLLEAHDPKKATEAAPEARPPSAPIA